MAVAFLCRKEGFALPLMIYFISSVTPFLNKGWPVKFAILLFAGVFALLLVWMDVHKLIIENYEKYKLLSQNESQGDSLGYFILYDLPFPLSTLASSVLLLFIKFPFWRNLFFDSYTFFVAITSLQMLFVAPAFLAIVLYMAFNQLAIEYKYLLYVILSLLLATAITSNQVRHFASVYPFLLLVYQSRKKILIGDRKGFYKAFQYAIFGSVVLLSIFAGFRR
jgi:hypothetical protein